MKRCTRLHVENLERGDLLKFTKDSSEPEKFFLAMVGSKMKTHHFGWVIRQVGDGEDIYIDDFDHFELVQKEAS